LVEQKCTVELSSVGLFNGI